MTKTTYLKILILSAPFIGFAIGYGLMNLA